MVGRPTDVGPSSVHDHEERAARRATTLVAYDRAVPIRLSSFIRIEGMTLKRLLLLVVLEDFAEEGEAA